MQGHCLSFSGPLAVMLSMQYIAPLGKLEKQACNQQPKINDIVKLEPQDIYNSK